MRTKVRISLMSHDPFLTRISYLSYRSPRKEGYVVFKAEYSRSFHLLQGKEGATSQQLSQNLSCLFRRVKVIFELNFPIKQFYNNQQKIYLTIVSLKFTKKIRKVI